MLHSELALSGHGGGADWSHQSFSHSTGLVCTGFGYVAAAHSLTEASNGLRPPGEYQTGGIVAVDPSTNKVRWKKRMPYALAHGNGILTTASDLLFIGRPDGNLLCLDARDGREQWRRSRQSDTDEPVEVDDDMWTVLDRRKFFVVGYTPGGAPYGVFEDEMEL